MKFKIKLFIFCIFILICCYYFRPIEKIVWSVEQYKITNGDKVVYSQWSDKFGWKGSYIFTSYKTSNPEYPYGITNEDVRFEKRINYMEKFYEFCELDEPISELNKVEILVNDFPNSEYSFLLNYELDDFWERLDSYKRKYKFVFYILDDRYLISNSQNEILDDYEIVYIYDLHTKERYYYNSGMVANVPKATLVPDKLINPRFFANADGGIYCIYKCYNKLYYHQFN